MQDRFERFVVSITELHRYLQKLKELEMGQMDLKAGYTMCLYYLGKHPEGLTATQLTELCKEDKAAISRTLSQLSSKGLVSCELPEHKRSYRTLYVSGKCSLRGALGRVRYPFASGYIAGVSCCLLLSDRRRQYCSQKDQFPDLFRTGSRR
jgi:DNA-binding transcriptional ArsR family regulator